METIKKCIRIALIKVAFLSIAGFYGSVVALKFLYFRIRFGPEFFRVKERRRPPACLQDPAFKHSHINVKEVKLHVVEAGEQSKPLMLFVHGFPGFWFSWRHQLKYFCKDYWVVAFDMRGYGDSDKPKQVSSYNRQNLVGDVVNIVKALGKKNCILVGHDWGGVIGWYTAAASSTASVVDKLIILNAPHPKAFKEKFQSSWKQFSKSWYTFFFQLPILPEIFGLQNDLEIFDKLLVKSDASHIETDVQEAYKYTFSTFESWTPPINFYRANLTATEVHKYNQEILKMPKIGQPTLVIWGENDEKLEPDFPERSLAYCNGVTEIRRIKNGNHFIQTDRPEEVNAAIAKFLKVEI